MASSGRQASLSLPLLRPPGKVGRWQLLRGLGSRRFEPKRSFARL